MYYKPIKFYENRLNNFWENNNFKLFSDVTTINFEGRSKTKNKQKKMAENICNWTPDIEFERDWSAGLSAIWGDATGRKLKTIFLVSRIFPRKADSVILLGFECTIKPQNLIKIVGAIFDKSNI